MKKMNVQNSTQIKNTDIEAGKFQIKNAVCLIFSVHNWGNRKVADTEKIETKADKGMLRLSKHLIESKGELKDAKRFQYTRVKSWIEANSVPSFFRDGVYLFNIDMVSQVEQFLIESSQQLQVLVDKFIEVYPEKIRDGLGKLDDQGNAKDYPSAEKLRSMFKFTWQWVAFDIPQGLPDDVFQIEKLRVEKMWSDAAEQITASLREAFRDLIAHAAEMLKTDADGKTKRFKDSSFGNIAEFCETFKNRNLTDDKELEALVNSAKKVLTGIEDPQELKSNESLRKNTTKSFNEIKKNLDMLVVAKPKRKFDFE